MRRQATLLEMWSWENHEDTEVQDQPNDDEQQQLKQSIREKFKNQFWYRIVSLEIFIPETNDRFPMSDDIEEDLKTI